MKIHVKFANKLVLTTCKTVKVLEYRQRRMVCPSQYIVFCLTVFLRFDRYKFYVHVCEAHFQTESIGASLVIIACNLGKLFEFLVGFST